MYILNFHRIFFLTVPVIIPSIPQYITDVELRFLLEEYGGDV